MGIYDNQVIIDRQGAAMTEALLMLEQAHTAAHQGDLPNCMAYLAQAMEILASDDPGPSEAL